MPWVETPEQVEKRLRREAAAYKGRTEFGEACSPDAAPTSRLGAEHTGPGSTTQIPRGYYDLPRQYG